MTILVITYIYPEKLLKFFCNDKENKNISYWYITISQIS